MEISPSNPGFHGSEVCILETPERAAVRPELQTWTSLLPVRLGDFAGGSQRGCEASSDCCPMERGKLAAAAQVLCISLADFLQAGFAALLSRLARQEAIEIVRAGKDPARFGFRCEEKISLAAMVREWTVENIDPNDQDLDLSRQVGYEFSAAAPSSPWLEDACLGLSIRDDQGWLRVTLLSGPGLWSTATLERWLKYLRNLWMGAAASTDAPVHTLPLLPESEIIPVYARLNDTDATFSDAGSVPEIFAQRARETPDAPAARSSGKAYSYRELDLRSTNLAQVLVEMGAGAGKAIAVCMEPSADLALVLMAVLRSGCCYVPLDPYTPARRLRNILEECRPIAVIADATTAPMFAQEGLAVLSIDKALPPAVELPLPKPDPESIAYVIYTSGTTGQPKGAMIPHRGLRNALCATRDTLRLGPSDRFLAVSTISFDMASLEMLLPLVTGGCVIVAPGNTGGDPGRLSRFLRQHDITVLCMTPVSWRMLVDSGWAGKPDLKMISGGEALPRELADRLLVRGAELWNAYGPTETSICCAHLRVAPGKEQVPIGPPVANTSFYVADAAGRPLPEDVPGELWIGGAGVGIGYLGKADLTRSRFVPDPLRPEKLVYRSGDLVRLTGGRELQFLGRVDSQVKLRGYRIELEEIESVFRSHPGVGNAAAVLREDEHGDPALMACVTLRGPGVTAAQLRQYAGQFLPEYMLPNRIGILNEMPLTSSGKIDRSRLPTPERTRAAALGAEPTNDLERKLLAIFHDVLGERAMGVTDSFFDFGGYSLLIVRLFARINRELKLNLPISVVFEAPSVRQLAAFIREGAYPSTIVPVRPGGSRTPLFVIHSYLIYDALAKAVAGERPIYGVRERAEDAADMPFEARADMYAQAIAEQYPQGPVHLAAWCAAASMTVEVAHRLDAVYGRNGLVLLIDAELPGFLNTQAKQIPFSTRLRASLRFHSSRFRSLPLLEKGGYIGGMFYHRWEGLFEHFSRWHPDAALWLQRRFPSVFPIVGGGDNAVASIMATRTKIKPYSGQIVLFCASDVPDLPGFDVSNGWNTIATRAVKVVFVPGDHISMFREPHVNALGRQIELALSGFESELSDLPGN